MSRVGTVQSDLFASTGAPALLVVQPIVELRALLDWLRSAERLPWEDAAGAMAEERRALGLARLAGEEGAAIAASILDETERLLAAAEGS